MWQSLAPKIGTVEADYLNGEIVLLGRVHGAPNTCRCRFESPVNQPVVAASILQLSKYQATNTAIPISYRYMNQYKSGTNVSIESSTLMSEGRVYFANSGGRIVGLDISRIEEGEAPVVFDYYAGGDIDATLVADDEGFFYASIEYEPSQMSSVEQARNREVGQLVKLDPFADGDPRVWGVDLTAQGDSGLWSTPALYGDMLYVNTHTGDLIAVDKDTGDIVWSDQVGFHSWSSPAVVDGTLVVATCTGELRGYSLADPRAPTRVWTVSLGEACLEATPAIWEGTIYLGSRDGFIRAFR